VSEEWKDIKDYKGSYQVSNLGEVKSVSRFIKHNSSFTGKIKTKEITLKKYNRKGMYSEVYLYSDIIKRKRFDVHRLVAVAFIKNPESKKEVNHIDGNKHNNEVNNLEWVTRKENSEHAIKTGLHKCFGENNGRSKLKEKEVLLIRKLHKEGTLCFPLAEKFKVSWATINLIVKRKSWKHI